MYKYIYTHGLVTTMVLNKCCAIHYHSDIEIVHLAPRIPILNIFPYAELWLGSCLLLEMHTFQNYPLFRLIISDKIWMEGFRRISLFIKFPEADWIIFGKQHSSSSALLILQRSTNMSRWVIRNRAEEWFSFRFCFEYIF